MSRVLVADDARGRRTAVGAALADRGYEVTTESDRHAAVERVREADPAVAVLAVDPDDRTGSGEGGPIAAVERVVAAGPTPVVAVRDPAVATDDLDAVADAGGVAVVPASDADPTDAEVEGVVEAVEAVEGTALSELATAVTAATARSVRRTVTGSEGSTVAEDAEGSTVAEDAEGSTVAGSDGPDAAEAEGSTDGEPVRAGTPTPGTPTGRTGDTRTAARPDGRAGQIHADRDPAEHWPTGGSDGTPEGTSIPAFEPPGGEFAPTIVVGASTGGPNVVETVLSGLPRSLDARVLVVQHMPESFTGRLADHLDGVCEYDVCEATDDATVGGGEAVVARGDRHLRVTGRDGDRIRVASTDEDPVHGVRPAVDVTMGSAAEFATRPLVGVVLTGMGRDGAAGVEAVRAAGGLTVAQDRDTSTVFGMPERAIATGAVDAVVPAADVPAAICERLQEEP